MKELYASLSEKGIEASMTSACGDKLAEIGYDKKYGARPLRRAIRTNIEDTLSDMYLDGSLNNVSKVIIDYRDNEFVIDTIKGDVSIVPPIKPESKKKTTTKK